MEWKCSEFAHLSSLELYAILRARSAVFVVEYAHIHLDIDDKDEAALHIFALESDGLDTQVAAYARLLPGDEQDPEVVIDKLLTSAKRRDDDTRDLLMSHALAAAQTVWPNHPIHINVSAHLEVFYETFGFRKAVGPFLEHGTPYIGMACRNKAAVVSDARGNLVTPVTVAAKQRAESIAMAAHRPNYRLGVL